MTETAKPEQTVGLCFVWSSAVYVLGSVVVRSALPISIESTTLIGGDIMTSLYYTVFMAPILFAGILVITNVFFDSTIALKPAFSWRVVCVLGLNNVVVILCYALGSPTDRTPLYLQGVLVAMGTPCTVFVRRIVLGKGLSPRRWICTVAVVVGVLISMVPRVLEDDTITGSTSSSTGSSLIARIVWPSVYAFGSFPAAYVYVVLERELKEQRQGLNIMLWSHVTRLLLLFPVFWLDLVPSVGTADSLQEFAERAASTVNCSVSLAPECHYVGLKTFIYTASYVICMAFCVNLYLCSDGAASVGIVQGMISPLTALFWTVFKLVDDTDGLEWDPEWSLTTACTLAGLAVIVPSVIVFHLKEGRDVAEENGYKMLK